MHNWINDRFGTNFSEEQLKPIADFTLVWNIFEKAVCNTNFTIEKFERALQGKNIDVNPFQNILTYFQDRYVSNGKTNDRFEKLNFRRNDRKDFVAEVLLNAIGNTEQILLAIGIIIYRFRNNLFHGVKEMRVIDEQVANFTTANNYLKSLLSYY